MESTREKLLSWDQVSELVDNKQELNPIDRFLYDNMPAGHDDELKFTNQFRDAIAYERDETRTCRNSELISSFMEHCKEEHGIEIPDKFFESFFNA